LTLIEIDNAGHCLHDESPEEVNRLILDWLAAEIAAVEENGTVTKETVEPEVPDFEISESLKSEI
jgi:hypothetical protein